MSVETSDRDVPLAVEETRRMLRKDLTPRDGDLGIIRIYIVGEPWGKAIHKVLYFGCNTFKTQKGESQRL